MPSVTKLGVGVAIIALWAAMAQGQTTATQAAATTATVAKATATTGSPVLTGRSFVSPNFNPPHFEAGNMQLLAHYGKLQASADIPAPVSKVRVQLKPRPTGASVPVVGLLFERRSRGPYVAIKVLVDEPVKDATEIVKDVKIEPGVYDVTLQFFKSSGPERTALEIHKISLE